MRLQLQGLFEALDGRGRRDAGIELATALWALSLFASGAIAQNLPVPPCAGSPYPAAGAVGESLNQLVWIGAEVPDDWSPPGCTGWAEGPSRALLAAAGRFRMAGDSSTMAARLAAISGLEDLVYWSSSRGRWRNLFREAVALSGPDAQTPREDFAADDLVPGAGLYYLSEEDNPTAAVFYQMLVHERTEDRLLVETVNRSSLQAKLLFIRREVAAPGEFRQLYYIEREAGEVWRFYALMRMTGAGGLAGTSAANYRNRTEAYFRYLAGLPMTREPPASR